MASSPVRLALASTNGVDCATITPGFATATVQPAGKNYTVHRLAETRYSEVQFLSEAATSNNVKCQSLFLPKSVGELALREDATMTERHTDR